VDSDQLTSVVALRLELDPTHLSKCASSGENGAAAQASATLGFAQALDDGMPVLLPADAQQVEIEHQCSGLELTGRRVVQEQVGNLAVIAVVTRINHLVARP
jgi:hypothetical protein